MLLSEEAVHGDRSHGYKYYYQIEKRKDHKCSLPSLWYPCSFHPPFLVLFFILETEIKIEVWSRGASTSVKYG